MTNIITKEQLIEQHHEQHKQRQQQPQQQSLLSRQPPSPHRLQQKSAHEALLLSQLQSLRNGITNEQYVNNSKDGMISNCHQWPRERVNDNGYPVTTNNSIHTTTTGSSGNISNKYGVEQASTKQKKRQRRGRKPRANSHHNDEEQCCNSGESSAENNNKVATSQLDSYLRYRAISTGDRPAGTDSVSRELSNDGSSVYRDQQSFILQRQRLHQRRAHDTATRNGANDFVYHSDLYNNGISSYEQQQKPNHYYGNSEACISFNSSQDYSLPRGSTVQYSDRGSYYSNQSGTTKTSSLAENSIGDCYTTNNSNSWTKRSDLYLFLSISHLITIIYLATSTSNEQDGRSSREITNIILSSISFFISITIGMGCYYLPFQGYMTTSTSSSLPSKSQRKRSEYYEYLYSSMQSINELSSSNGSSINTKFHRLRSNVTLEQMLVVLTFILTSVNCGLILYPTYDSLAVDDEGEQEVTATGNGQVWNATLFCSLWASLYGCAYNLMIVLTRSDGNESRRRDFIQRLWLMSVFSSTCAFITMFIVYSRSACAGQYLNGTLYCTSAFMGGFFNVGCSLLSFIVCVYLLRTSKKMRSGYCWTQSTRLQWFNLVCASILLGVSSTNVAYISRPSGGSGNQVGNAFVTSWSTWIISVILWRKSIGLLISSSFSATLPISSHDTDKSADMKSKVRPTYARHLGNTKLEDSMRSGDVTHGTSIDDSERNDYSSTSSSATSILVTPEEDKRVKLDPEEQPTYSYQDNGDIIVDFHGQAASPSQSLVRQAGQECSMGEETDCSHDSLQEKVDALKLDVQLICQETVSSLGTGNTTLSSLRDSSSNGEGLYNLDTSSRSPRAVPCMSPQELLQVELDAITGNTAAEWKSAQEKMYSMVYSQSPREEDQQEDEEVTQTPETPTQVTKLIKQPSDRRRSMLTESWRSNLSPLQEATSSEEGSSAAPDALPKRRRGRSKSKKKKVPSNNSKPSSTYKGSRRQTPPPPPPPPPPPRPITPTRLKIKTNPSYGEKKPSLGSNESRPKTISNKTSDGSSTKPELSSDDNYLTKRMSTEETQLLGSYANTESESPPACSSVSTSSSDFDIILNDQNSSQSGITEPSVYDKYGVKDGLVLPLKSKEAMKVALKHAAATHSAKQAKMKKPTRQLRQSESSQSDMAKSVEALLSKYAMSCMNAHDMSTNAIDDSYRQNYVRSEGLRTSAGDESVCSASRIRSKSEDTTGLNKKEESTLESTCSITRSRSSQQLSTSSTSRYSSIDTSDLENHKPSSKGGISSSDEVSSACDSELV